MIRSFLIGLVAGSRAIAPLAAVTDAAARDALPTDGHPPRWVGRPAVTLGTKLLAAGELWGDKLPDAPDRIAPIGIAARVVSGGLAGAALAPRGRAVVGAMLGATAAVIAAYVTFDLRKRAMARFGQTPTGMAEDALTLGATRLVMMR